MEIRQRPPRGTVSLQTTEGRSERRDGVQRHAQRTGVMFTHVLVFRPGIPLKTGTGVSPSGKRGSQNMSPNV